MSGLPRRGVYGGSDRRSGPLYATEAGAVAREASYGEQLGSMSLNNFSAGVDALEGVVQKATGFDDAANANFTEFSRLSGLARRSGPEIQSWGDVEQRGVTAGNVGQYLGAQVANMVPDVGLALAGAAAGTLAAPGVGTVGGLFGGTAVRKTAQEAAEAAAESYAKREAARLAAAGIADDVAMQSARAGAVDAGKTAAAQMFAKDAATQALTNQIQRATTFAGATAAGVPSALNDERTVQLAQEGTAQDAMTLLGGGVAQAMLDTIPILRAVDKVGGQVTGEAIKATTDRFLKRALKETAVQGGLEGATEVGQEVLKNASHAIVTENPELLYEPDALKNYLVSFATGAVLGGALGGGVEAGGAAGRQAQRTARQVWEATNNYFRDKIRGPVQADPGVAQNQAQADETVDASRTPRDPSILQRIRERISYGPDVARRSAEIEAQSEAATRSFNEWRRTSRDFPLSGDIQRLSGQGAEINLTMLTMVDGLPAFASSLAKTQPRDQAADFLARTGSALYRSFTAPQTLTEADQQLVAAVQPYITPARRTVMESLASDWAARQAQVDAERTEREAEAAPPGAAEDAEPALRGREQATQDYEGDLREDSESPTEGDDGNSRFSDMQPEVRVRPVDAYLSALRAPADNQDLEAMRGAAIAELEGEIKAGNRYPNNVIAAENKPEFFARRSQENGVLPYGEGRVWDAVGHARRLLAQNREAYANSEQPAKLALLDALSQAAAVGMPVDFSALRPGAYRMDRSGQELVRLTQEEIDAVSGIRGEGPTLTGRRPTGPVVPANPDSVVPFVDIARDDNGEALQVVAQRPNGTVSTRIERRDSALRPPEQYEADYRLGPGPTPAGAEARGVFPANRNANGPVRPPPPVYDEDGSIVEDGWEPASGGGYRNTATGQIITDANQFRAATLDTRGTVPDMSPLRSVSFPSGRPPVAESPETTAAKELGAAVGADVDPITGLPKITHPISSRNFPTQEDGRTRVVVRYMRNNKRASTEVLAPEFLVGWSPDAVNAVADTTASNRAAEIASSNRVKADFLPTVPNEVRYDTDMTSPDARAILKRMFNSKDGYAQQLGIGLRKLPDNWTSTKALVSTVRDWAQEGDYDAARIAERFLSGLEGLADLAGPSSLLARVLAPEDVKPSPVVARSAAPWTPADPEAMGRTVAERASDAELAAVKDRAANAKTPFGVSRLNNAQAEAVQKAAIAFVRKLDIPTLLTRFGGFLRRDGDVETGATTVSVSGKHFVTIHTANMRKPDALLDGADSNARLKRTIAHEMAHVLDRMHHDATGNLLSADPEFAPGSELWAQVEASVDADPVLAKSFGYILEKAKTDPAGAQRELFAQLVSLRETHPRILNEQVPYAAGALRNRVQVARDAALARAGSRAGVDSENAGSEAEGVRGEDGRDVPARAGSEPEPGAAAGRDRQRDAVLKSDGTMGPSAPVPAGAMVEANAGQSFGPTSVAQGPNPQAEFGSYTQPVARTPGRAAADRRLSADPEAARREADAEAAQTTADQTAEQRTREGAYAEALMRNMGFPPAKVTVESHTASNGAVRAFEGGMTVDKDGNITITLGDALSGAERMEVLQHEVGHAVLLQHIAKTAEIPLSALIGPNGEMPSLKGAIDMLAEADPKLHAALKADYDQWLAKNANKAKGVNTMLASRGGLARGAGRNKRGGSGTRLRDMDQAEVDALMSMEEWIADGVVRALNTNSTATSITGKFFAELARLMRSLYDKLTGTMRTPPSIENWINGLFDAEAKRFGGTVAEGRRKVLERAADFLHRMERGLPPDIDVEAGPAYETTYEGVVDAWMDVVTFALTPEQRQIMGRIVFRDDIEARLKAAFDGNKVSPALKAALDDPAMALEARTAALFALNTGPEGFRLEAGPNTNNVLAKLRGSIATWLGYVSDADYAETILDAARDGSLQKIADGNRATFDKVVAERIARRKRKLPVEGDPKLTRVSFDHRTPTLSKASPQKQKVTKAVERAEALFEKARTVYARTVAQSVYERAESSGISSLRELASRLFTPGDVGGTDRGLIRAAEHKVALEQQKIIRATEGLSEKELDDMLGLLQRAEPTLPDTRAGKAAQALRTQLRDFHAYATAAGVKLGFQPDFFPVVPDVDGDRTETVEYLAFAGNDPSTNQPLYAKKTAKVTPKQAKLFALMNQPKFEAEMRAFKDALVAQRRDARIAKLDDLIAREKDPKKLAELQQQRSDENDKSKVTLESLSGMALDFVESAIRDPDFAATADNNPRARGANRRSMDFIYKLGTPEEIAAFAEVQSKDLASILSGYYEPMVRKAEYTRRLGNGRYERLLARIEAEGGTAEDVAFARDMVSAALGTYGADGSPVIGMVSKGLAKKLHGRGAQATISNVMAYQNWRLLPLALLSSMSDPILIGLRAGGDMGTTFDGIRQGIRAQYNAASKAEMEQMIAQIGAAADFGAEANLQYALGGLDQTSFSRRSNDILFRWNGMTWLAKATRHMALHTAHGFLSRHALRPNEFSERYFTELGLKPGDIEVESVLSAEGRMVERVKLDTGDKARDYRVSQALLNFVDDAVLRPNAMQSPLWHADPYMGLVTQYKSFVYAMWDQFGRRIGTEFNNGNFVGLLPAMLAYVPLAIMAMLMREEIQYGGEGNPNRSDWTAVDYTQAAMTNSGMLGPGAMFLSSVQNDLNEARTPVLTQLGPTFSQTSNVVETAVGERNAGETFQEALPWSAAWEKRVGTEPLRQGQQEPMDLDQSPQPEGAEV